ncbi:MAG TPA: CaiB/BaiF CoA-transferase family protein [Burkholderiales bacterium]|jgi:itaconate CoA-transferase|nr:CaiB/BaiF CoA-transferase family protein [Burkholderiales bacterium]
MLPLQGITVVSLEQAVAAPFASRQLADLGARVIKIERPGVGDFARDYDQSVKGQSAYFVWLNRSKESLTLDVKHPQAGEILGRLLGTADVFIQNLAPGAAKRLGLDAATLLEKNPRLIVCDISGYGDSGPYADKKAYDLLVQSEAGVLSVTGTEEAPSKVGISITDIGTGLHAYAAILAALYERERTGKGRRIEVTMFEAMVEWMNHPLYYTHFSGRAPKRSGPDHATIVPYGRFRAGDGKHVMFGIQNEREWASFCGGVLQKPELAKDPRYDNNTKRTAARADVVGLIEGVFADLTAEEVVSRLDAAGIANARLNSPEEVWNHPQLAARKRWRDVDSPAGPIPAVLPPATFEGVEARMDPIPAVGEHTDRILGELGYSAEQIASLRQASGV